MGAADRAIVRALTSHRAQLLAYIWSIVREPQIVEDVFQNVCIAALEQAGDLHDENKLMSWLRAVARNKAVDAIKARRRGPVAMDADLLDLIEGDWERQDAMATAHRVEALEQCVRQLSGYGRQIVELRYGAGLTTRLVAKKLNRNVEAVYKALTRVHVLLGNCLREKLAIQEGADVW